MAAAANQSELIGAALKAIQRVRSSVTDVFDHLRDGIKEEQGQEANEKVFVAKLQEDLVVVNGHVSELEKASGAVSRQLDTLGNVGLLNMDPVQDKTPLYSQLLKTYRWSNKVHEHAALASSILTLNSMKRTIMPSGLSSVKRRKPQPNSHALSKQAVDKFFGNIEKNLPDLSISITRTTGSNAIIQVVVGRTCKAVLALRGLLIENVIVRGYDEESTKEDGSLDLWTKSTHQVFQQVTDHVTSAMLHYHLPQMPEVAFKHFIRWLNSYTTLFSVPCTKCGKFLQNGLVPTWRDMKSLAPLHFSCRL